MQASSGVVLQENEAEIIEFKRISDNKNILYISNIPVKFHEEELQVNLKNLVLSLTTMKLILDICQTCALSNCDKK